MEKMGKTGNGIVICCSKRNRHTLIDALNALGWNFTSISERTVDKIFISSNECNAFVDRFGYKAEGKRIDFDTMCLPADLLEAFIDGIVDSDGCFTNNRFKVTSVSKELVYGLGQCIAKVYHRPFSIYKTKRNPKTIIEGRIVNQKDTYSIVWSKNNSKQDKAFYENGYIWFPINEISRSEFVGNVYNMSVEEDESYTANGCIVHNCTDISSAGQQRGLQEGSGTRSSLLWECRKAIEAKKPRYLLMENVKALTSEKFMPFLIQWEQWLAEQGYSNFTKVLNSKDYGVPQNRERVFMVSLLDEQTYHFPEPFELKLRLKDVLEQNVDERYYLSPKMLENATFEKKITDVGIYYEGDVNKGGQKGAIISANGICTALTATDYKQPKQIVDPKIITYTRDKKGKVVNRRAVDIANTIHTSTGSGGNTDSFVLEPNMFASELDTEETNEEPLNDVCVEIVSNNTEPFNTDKDGLCRTIKAQYYKNGMANFKDNGSFGATGVIQNYRIRKLSERECFRLMGVSEADIDKIQASGVSKTQQYKMAGNSIVVDVLVHIFRKMFVEKNCESEQLVLF